MPEAAGVKFNPQNNSVGQVVLVPVTGRGDTDTINTCTEASADGPHVMINLTDKPVTNSSSVRGDEAKYRAEFPHKEYVVVTPPPRDELPRNTKDKGNGTGTSRVHA